MIETVGCGLSKKSPIGAFANCGKNYCRWITGGKSNDCLWIDYIPRSSIFGCLNLSASVGSAMLQRRSGTRASKK